MDSLHTLILDNIVILMIVVMGMLLLLFLLVIIFLIRFAQLRKKYIRLMTGKKKLDLEQTLYQYMEQVEMAIQQQNNLSQSVGSLERRITNKLGTAGVIRFNAFGNTGSDLSYAVALLDSDGTGVVLSSIYGREESRTYAKPIDRGNSNYLLTDEEKQAIEQVMRRND